MAVKMTAMLWFCVSLFASPFKSKFRLEAENAILRQQLIVLERKIRSRVRFTNADHLFFVALYRWFPSVLNALRTIRPETFVRWHHARFSSVLALQIPIIGRSVENQYGSLLYDGQSVTVSTLDVAALDVAADCDIYHS